MKPSLSALLSSYHCGCRRLSHGMTPLIKEEAQAEEDSFVRSNEAELSQFFSIISFLCIISQRKWRHEPRKKAAKLYITTRTMPRLDDSMCLDYLQCHLQLVLRQLKHTHRASETLVSPYTIATATAIVANNNRLREHDTQLKMITRQTIPSGGIRAGWLAGVLAKLKLK